MLRYSFQKFLVLFTYCGLTVFMVGLAHAAPAGDERFIRIDRSANSEPRALQTAIVTFSNQHAGAARKGEKVASVDLIIAVHIGEKSYFESLNREFKEYDAVLYELVAPKDEVVEALAQEQPNPLSSVQRGLTQALGLQFQLDEIDYRRPNLLHADLSPDEFVQSMKRRGESATSMFVKFLAASLEQQKSSNPFDGLAALSALLDNDPKRKAIKLKRILAAQTEDMETLVKSINGDEGSTLISERNARALQVLREQLANGKTKLAIYYGAAHMSNFSESLEHDFQMKAVKTRWLDAWNLR